MPKQIVTSSPAVFLLEMKINQLNQIAHALLRVQSLPEAERSTWVREHHDALINSFNEFIDQSHQNLQNVSLDPTNLHLSQEFVLKLRDAVGLFNDLVIDAPKADIPKKDQA